MSSAAGLTVPSRIRQGRFADTTSRAARPLPVDRYGSHDRKQGAAPARRIRRTHQRGANRMTPLIQRTSSARVAPHRSEPAVARTSNWHPGQGASGTDSLRLDCRIFHSKKTSGNRPYTSIKATLARAGRQDLTSASTSTRPTRPRFTERNDRDRITAPVATGPVAALGITVISSTTSSREQEGRRRGTVDGLR